MKYYFFCISISCTCTYVLYTFYIQYLPSIFLTQFSTCIYLHTRITCPIVAENQHHALSYSYVAVSNLKLNNNANSCHLNHYAVNCLLLPLSCTPFSCSITFLAFLATNCIGYSSITCPVVVAATKQGNIVVYVVCAVAHVN